MKNAPNTTVVPSPDEPAKKSPSPSTGSIALVCSPDCPDCAAEMFEVSEIDWECSSCGRQVGSAFPSPIAYRRISPLVRAAATGDYSLKDLAAAAYALGVNDIIEANLPAAPDGLQ